VPSATTGANDQAKSSHEDNPGHAVVDRARESSASRAATSYRRPPSRRAQALSARAVAVTTIITTTNPVAAVAEAAAPSNAGYHRQQVSIDRPLATGSMAPQYKAVPPPKYYGESDPHKFLMCYEASIASVGGDDTTLTKSFIISLENAAGNWYARLQPISITSWGRGS
jgi:hypothetical protein